MLSINVSHAKPFLSYPYEEVLCPRLARASSSTAAAGATISSVGPPARAVRPRGICAFSPPRKIQGDSKALVVIGIGGSYLGARGVIECLCSPNYNLKKKDTPQRLLHRQRSVLRRAARGDEAHRRR